MNLRKTPTIAERAPASTFLNLRAEAQVKLDGEWITCVHSKSDTTFLNRRSWTGNRATNPRLSAGIARIFGAKSVIVVGELCSRGFYGENGFLRLRENRDSLTLVLFDVLELIGRNLRQEPFICRWGILTNFMEKYRNSDPVRLVPSFTVNNVEEALKVFNASVENGFEGIILKPHNSAYVNNAWLKWKHTHTEDAKIMGIRKTKGFKETGIASSWLIGIETPTGLKQKGCVGSGLDWNLRKRLTDALLKAKTGEDNEFIYVQPLVTLEITHNGDLGESFRSPRIIRIRTDK